MSGLYLILWFAIVAGFGVAGYNGNDFWMDTAVGALWVWNTGMWLSIVISIYEWRYVNGSRKSYQTRGSGTAGSPLTVAWHKRAGAKTAGTSQGAGVVMGSFHVHSHTLIYPVVEQEFCSWCGMMLQDGVTHECPTSSDHDRAVVRTITTLFENGLSAEEVAEDTGVVVGWRFWQSDYPVIRGIGMGRSAPWHPGVPLVAVCTQGEECRELCNNFGASLPRCRVHAMNSQESAINEFCPGRDLIGLHFRLEHAGWLFGRVAMWGDVITADRGYLASRAYPLSLSDKQTADRFGVAWENVDEYIREI